MNPSEITISDNGPIRISGASIIIKDASGNIYDLNGREMISLCRCGQSANKPFCDGSHRKSGFVSTVTACQLPPKS